jgi:predicted ATPase
MTEDEGCRLFAGRAAATSSNPTSSLSDKAAISRLVTLLDGLPLAIELAAARSRVLSPRMLLDRMNERFTVLAMRGGRLDRQVTLRATLDWSWELLSTRRNPRSRNFRSSKEDSVSRRLRQWS